MGDLRGAAAPADMGQALGLFAETLVKLAIARNELGLRQRWLAEGMNTLWADAEPRLGELQYSDWREYIVHDEPYDDPASMAAFAFLNSELLFIAFRHRELLSEASRATLEEMDAIFVSEPVDLLSERVVEDCETVYGSVEKLLQRLPKWLRRVADIALEALKLSRGLV
ncbi:hypothetical protein [Stakelama tenebrarum]|uniref:Uncharacterized protein n=1 Tax=Stakelama tenebrarum TaxID=2711215 RepID=A0A6G6Y6J2_9SPHN|nr:hypothetical protein [Sphingosinithalassobacter tenebrarum]QIG80535.1 hypothetical protein G5C33_12595 [Sphingosinithalassobacter tenebrarum]